MASAFDHVSHPRLLHDLRPKGIPEYIVKWTESFLKDRSTSVTLEKSTSDVLSVHARIPQESPILPIFLFFNAPLMEESVNPRLRVYLAGFVDDIHLLAYDASTEVNSRTLERAH